MTDEKRYDVSYIIHNNPVITTIRGKSITVVRKVFKKIYGGWEIIDVTLNKKQY